MHVISMRLLFPRIVFAALVVAFGMATVAPFARPAYAQGPCTTRGDNLTRNGSITEGGYDTAHGVVANSWNAFLMGGEWPQYDLADNESAIGDIGGSSSQYIHGDGITFDAGIYQVVAGVQAGASYEVIVGWAKPLRDIGGGQNRVLDDVIMRRIGVEPAGGTDPNAGTMIWGAEVWDGKGLNHPEMRLTFKAASNQVTIFLRVKNNNPAPSDKVFYDVMCLLPRGDIPVETIQPSVTPTPLATAIPPTDADPPTPRPTRVPPTATPIPETPVPAQVFTPTPASAASLRETATPERRAAIPTLDDGSSANRSSNDTGDSSGGGLSLAVIVGSIGIIGVSLLGILLIGGFVVWRIFMRQVDEALDPAYYPDDQTPYQ